jgi:hypothetical protein
MNRAFSTLAKESGIVLEVGSNICEDEQEEPSYFDAVQVGSKFEQTLELLQSKLEPPYNIIHEDLTKENSSHEIEVHIVAPNVIYKGTVIIGHMDASLGSTLDFWMDTNELKLID